MMIWIDSSDNTLLARLLINLRDRFFFIPGKIQLFGILFWLSKIKKKN